MNNKSVFLISLLMFFSYQVRTAIVGSNTAVAVEGLITFPEADNGTNEMRGFSAFDNGFELETFDTTCTFSSFFPIRSRINLNGGILYLQRDLIIGSSARIETVGEIFGNGYKTDFTASITKLDFEVSRTFTFNNTILNLKKDLFIDIPILVDVYLEVHGLQGTTEIVFGDNGYITVASGGKLELENCYINGLRDKRIICEDDSAEVEFKGVTIELSGDFEWATGSIEFKDDVIITGTHKFIYSSVVGSTIKINSRLIFDRNITFSYVPAVALNNLILFEDQSSKLFFKGGRLHVGSSGLQITKGTIEFDNHTIFSSDAAVQSEGIFFGDGVAANDPFISFFPFSTLELESGYLVNN